MRHKIVQHIGLNLFGYIFFAISGILLNIIIGIYFDATVLGVFNTVYAIYILLSQVCVFGQNFTIMSFTSNTTNIEERKRYLVNSLILTFFISIIVSIVFFIIAPVFNTLFNSHYISIGLRIVAIALPGFALNKVLIGYLNGTTSLKAFSLFRNLRMVMIALFMYIVCVINLNPNYITVVFPIAEYLLLIMMVIYLRKEFKWKDYDNSIIKTFYKFGLQSMPIGLIAEINTRMDVLCLNLYLNDSLVGLYSFALMFAEGIYEIYIVIRQVVNPYIAKYRQELNYRYKDFLKNKLLLINYAIAFVGSIIALLVYKYAVDNIFKEYVESFNIFFILLVGIAINSYFIILSNYFVQSKKPIIESKISLVSVLSNTILDLLSIPIFGLTGAAIATVISYCIATSMQIYYAKKLKV